MRLPAVAPKKPTYSRGRETRQLRIIAGRWRGRRWHFPDTAMRPTPDRVRETLFNWLQPYIAGRHCLDLFAGSGALGLEALSRGAARVRFVDSNPQAVTAIAATAAAFGAAGAEVLCADAPLLLQQRPAATDGRFDLVFIDPPFDSGLAATVLRLLVTQRWLAPGALIYVEQARSSAVEVPTGCVQLKSGAAGAVSYHLYCSSQPQPGSCDP
jgi:16S rRNA (guanine966-N2)-methyltransferase